MPLSDSVFSTDPTLPELDFIEEPQQELHARAAAVRDTHFGKKVFVRGVVEVSNFCRENCGYCGMRRDNRDLKRYRLSLDHLMDLLIHHRPASMTDINIQAGEDPIAVRDIVLPLVQELKKQTSLGISVCLGTLRTQDYDALRDAGADYYVIKLETGDEEHYRQMHSPGNLPERLEAIRYLAANGWNVSSGLILGLPHQTRVHVARTLALLRELPLVGCSVSPFIPGEKTLFPDAASASLDQTLNCLALMRLQSPRRIIPAISAMTILDRSGYARAIRAGANLATINMTPAVERRDYLLYSQQRNIMTEERILREIENAGCSPSEVGISDYLKADRQH